MSRLIVHIGTGKTGTTAIQKFLLQNRRTLAERRVYYFGLNLEHVHTTKRFSWQVSTGIGIIQRMPVDQAREQLQGVILEAMRSIEEDAVAIWCNESIHEMPQVYIPVIRSCQNSADCTVGLIAYVRNMRDYIYSAYKQWGVKHKTYQGRVLGFSDWVKARQRFLAYGKKLNKWDSEFPDMLNLVNYDSAPNVVRDFLMHIPRSQYLITDSKSDEECKSNASPDDILLALYALYNNQFDGEALPKTISSLISSHNLKQSSFHIEPLSRLYPSHTELLEAERMLAHDIDLTNSMLKRHHQPVFSKEESSQMLHVPSDQSLTEGVLAVLLSIMVGQAQRIQALEEQVLKNISTS